MLIATLMSVFLGSFQRTWSLRKLIVAAQQFFKVNGTTIPNQTNERKNHDVYEESSITRKISSFET